MISITRFKFSNISGFSRRGSLAVAISLFASAASAQTYPVDGVWVATDDRFPGSTKGACFILKKIGIDGVAAQPFRDLMIFSDKTRFDVRGNHRIARTVRSVKIARTAAIGSSNR